MLLYLFLSKYRALGTFSCALTEQTRIGAWKYFWAWKVSLAFFTSQFAFCPLVWMCNSPTNNKKINRLYERCLRIVYNDKQPSFNELLEKDGSVSIHMRNIQILATEMYRLINNLSPAIINRVFKLNSDSRYKSRFAFFHIVGKLAISRDREYFLPLPKTMGWTTWWL